VLLLFVINKNLYYSGLFQLTNFLLYLGPTIPYFLLFSSAH
jgi:hypothetical protein